MVVIGGINAYNNIENNNDDNDDYDGAMTKTTTTTTTLILIVTRFKLFQMTMDFVSAPNDRSGYGSNRHRDGT